MMKSYVFLLTMSVCLYLHVDCRPQDPVARSLVDKLVDMLAEKRHMKRGSTVNSGGLPLKSASMRVADKDVESRGFSWVHVSPDQSHLERTARELIFKGATSSSEPSGEKVKGGYDTQWNQYYRLCQVNYNGGVHPGKYFNNNDGYVCHIGWGGQEKLFKTFNALINTCSDKTSAVWVPYPPTTSNSKSLPQGLLKAGQEQGNNGIRSMYFCRAWHEKAYNPGKILVEQGSSGPYQCNFSWGRKEHTANKFQVLVDTCNNKNNGKK